MASIELKVHVNAEDVKPLLSQLIAKANPALREHICNELLMAVKEHASAEAVAGELCKTISLSLAESVRSDISSEVEMRVVNQKQRIIDSLDTLCEQAALSVLKSTVHDAIDGQIETVVSRCVNITPETVAAVLAEDSPAEQKERIKQAAALLAAGRASE